MPKESAPTINIPFFSITATYPGADPKSVQDQLTQKIEDKLSSVNGISSYKSISTDWVSALVVEFKKWTDKNTAYNDLKSALDELKLSLPENTNLKLKKIDLIDFPVYTFSIQWDYYPSALYDKVRFIEDDLKKIQWVDRVETVSYTHLTLPTKA